MSNVKLGGQTINNIDVVQLEDADNAGSFINFAVQPVQNSYVVTFMANGDVYQQVTVKAGESIYAPANDPTPAVETQAFYGWKTSDGTTITFPYAPTANITLTAEMGAYWQATVQHLGSQDPGIVSFTVPGTNITKPWSETTFNGDVFIKINKMYKKVIEVADNQITTFSICNAKLDDSYKIYPCFLDEAGNELDYILIGKYMSKSDTTCNSVADGSVVSQAILAGRTRARDRNGLTQPANGVGYQLMDWRIQRLWQDLIICAYGKININSGSGIQTDELGIYWGATGQWIDGFCHIDTSWVYSNSPSKYIDSPTASSDGYSAISGYTAPTTSGQEISKLGYDEAAPFFNYPSETVPNSNYTTYYCDGYSYSSGNHPVYCLVGSSDAGCGAFYCNGLNGWTNTYGVRLCYRPAAT